MYNFIKLRKGKVNLYNPEVKGLYKEVSIKSQRRWSLAWIHIYRNLSDCCLIARHIKSIQKNLFDTLC